MHDFGAFEYFWKEESLYFLSLIFTIEEISYIVLNTGYALIEIF